MTFPLFIFVGILKNVCVRCVLNNFFLTPNVF